MKFLLDTNAWIGFLRAKDSGLVDRIRRTAPSEIALCSVVIGELVYGAIRSQREAHNLGLIANLRQKFQSLPFDDRAGEIYGRLRAQLAAVGTPIGPNDLLIAAIALANGLTVVTHNVTEFRRIPLLSVIDWQAGSA